MTQHVYIIGSKGIPARYGGYETFVEKLTAGRQDESIQYHVAARSDNSEFGDQPTFMHNDAEVYNIKVPNVGPAQAIIYDIKAMQYAIKDVKRKGIEHPIFYVLACRIGPFMAHFIKKIHAVGGQYFVNPDGHEWKRAKWSAPVRAYWKISERLMIKHADLVICDNLKIEEYIQREYRKYAPKTTFIAYGTDIEPSGLSTEDSAVQSWFRKHQIIKNDYYLIVGRFVPENNYATMIREFMASTTSKDLVIVTNVEHNKFYDKLLTETHFDQDKRIKFVGTVYDQPLLKYIRENAYAYIHGHEVGGTNPSLLEALASTHLNLLINVSFNRSVAENAALYWSKATGDLRANIEKADSLSVADRKFKWNTATKIIGDRYTWSQIVQKYEMLFN